MGLTLKKKIMKHRQLITILLACIAFSCSTREQFELKLTKNENLSNGVAFTITFLDSVFKIHNSLPVKIGVNPHGRNIAVWMDPGTDTSGFLWLDRDLDGIVDFGDSTPIIKNRPSSKIYVSSRENPACTLPFHVIWNGDDNENYFNWSAHYVYEGNIDYNGIKIPVRLSDINSDGLMNITDAQQGTNLTFYLPDTVKYPYGRWCRSTELIPIGNKFFTIDSMALDGSYLHFTESRIPYCEIGKPAPEIKIREIKGTQILNSKEFKGEWVLLDFWFTGCVPCLRKFPDLVKFKGKHKEILTVIGICVEKEQNREKALEIIEKYHLSWNHAFIDRLDPVWLSFGGINDNHLFMPLYVLIDPKGIIRYAGMALDGFEELEPIMN